VAATLTGCSDDEVGDPSTVPPTPPTQRLAGVILPSQVAGYTVLGTFPVSGQTEATYALDADSLALAVVTLTTDLSFGQTTLEDDGWYGASHCGLFDADAPEGSQQAMCVTPLVDGVLTVVGSTVQSPVELSALANAIYARLD
jgi:hypothetical protein